MRQTVPNYYDVIILGAGASGLMCASATAARGLKTLLIDHKRDFAQKLLISGGGRCNFSNLNMGAEKFICSNRNFVKSALARFSTGDFLSILSKHKIGFVEEDDGKLFLKGRSSLILSMFLSQIEHTVRIEIGKVSSVNKDGELFLLEGSFGKLSSSKIVVATGGISYRELGASSLGYEIAKQFGHKLTDLRPGLVPLTFEAREKKIFSELSGISFSAEVKAGKKTFSGSCLITHNGLSGPAILNASLFWKEGEKLSLNLLSNVDIAGDLKNLKSNGSLILTSSYLSKHLPSRLAKVVAQNFLWDSRICELSDKKITAFEYAIHNISFLPKGTSGFNKAEVTIGGVDTREVSSKTMESMICNGLFFIGEVLDVTGMLGGYNLHWAWASGSAAGNSF